MKKACKLIFALDTPDKKELTRWVDATKDCIEYYKVGLIPYTGIGPEALTIISKRKKKIFLDLKLYDIPNTMIHAALSGIRQGARLIDFHVAAGQESLTQAIHEVKRQVRREKLRMPHFFGVTILTSVAQKKSTMRSTLDYARIAKKSGCDGVVLSGKEASRVRRAMGKRFLLICPGIRTQKHGDDQKRVATPESIKYFADFIVVGRPIYASRDPRAAARDILTRLR